MRHPHVFMGFVLAFVIALTILSEAAAQDPDYVFDITYGSAQPGGKTTVAVTLRSDGESIAGFSCSICDDAAADMDYSGFEFGAGLDSNALDFFALDFGADSWSASGLMLSGKEFAPGETHEIFLATYEVLEVGESFVEFCPGGPKPTVTTSSGEIEATGEAGTITGLPPVSFLRGDVNGDGRVVPLQDAKYYDQYYYEGGDPPPCLEAADAGSDGELGCCQGHDLVYWLINSSADLAAPGTVTCSALPGGGALGCEIGPDECPSEAPVPPVDPETEFRFSDISADLEVGDAFELSISIAVGDGELQGFQFGVCHSGAIAFDPHGFFVPTPLETGAGWDFDIARTEVFDDGFTVAAVASHDGTNEIAVGEHEIMIVSYKITDHEISTIEFCDSLGYQPVAPVALRDMEIVAPILDAPIVIDTRIPPPDGMSFSGETGLISESVDVEILMSDPDASLEGWHWGVCHDDLVSIGVDDVVADDVMYPLSFTTHFVDYYRDGWTVTALLDIASGGTLTPGDRQTVYVATYHLGDEPGYCALTFCDTLGTPAVLAAWVVEGAEVTPPLNDGLITIRAELPFLFGMEAAPVPYDPSDLSLGLEFTVDLTIREDPFNADYPANIAAFTMALSHDGDILEILSAEPAGVIAEGDGPDFFAANLDPEGSPGLSLGAGFAFAGTSSISLDDVGNVVQVTYEVSDAALAKLAGNSTGMSTTIVWADELGAPPIDNAVYLGASPDAESVVLLNGVIEFVPNDLYKPFRRGDCDGNGTVSALADSVFLLSYGFLGGSPPPCLDAADANDNGSVSALLDALFLLTWQFLQGTAPPDPGTAQCGVDPTDDGAGCEFPPDFCL